MAQMPSANTAPPIRGDMKGFALKEPRADLPQIGFVDVEEKTGSLADFKGRVVLLNIWATWCGPCVEEMPSLERLQAELADEEFSVLALSQDRGGLPAVQKFFDQHGIDGLDIFVDKTTAASRALKLRGLPTSILIDRDGMEIGRIEGAARWDSADALALIRHYLGGSRTRPKT